MKLCVLFACVVMCVMPVFCSVSCLDEDGKSIDWWYAIKVPKISSSSIPSTAHGYAYAYGDSGKPALVWSDHDLSQNTTGAVAHTLAQIYSAASSASVGFLNYNDEQLGKEYTDYAHSKGVLAADKSGGFWLVHSVPRFPVPTPNASSYYYPDYETENGQSFLCMSVSSSTIDAIASLFLINKPYVIDSNFPAALATVYPSISTVLAKKWITAATAKSQSIATLKGASFTVFAKNINWGQDLYEDFVSPTFGQGMRVQSWREGTSSNLMPSFCRPDYKYDNENILTLQLYHYSDVVTWSYTKDHSKWGITLEGGHACIGDINRMFSQEKRGGGTVCTAHTDVIKSLTSMIAAVQSC